jgi:exosortase
MSQSGVIPSAAEAASSRAGIGATGRTASSARPITWAHLLVLAGAFGALFWVNFERLWQWTNPSSGDPNWGHALFIPLISLFYLLEHRDRVKQTPARPAPAGLIVVFGGIALFISGIGLGVSFVQFGPYLQDLGMLATLLGCVLAIFGWPMVRVAAFPIAYLLCALQWPPYVHDAMTVPLQHLAATASVRVLQLTGMNVEQAGNTLHILTAAGTDRALNVAEACAGMRSLITFFAIGLAVAFLTDRPLWQKVLISLSAVPIAIACNVFRIAGEGLLDQYVSRRLSEGFAHSAVGLVLLVPGFGLFLLVGWVLDRLVPRKKAGGKGGTAASGCVSPKAKIECPPDVGPQPRAAVPQGFRIMPRTMYVAVVGILLAGATGLAAASHVLHLNFVKVPVPLARPLTQFPADLGPWRQCGGNRTIPVDVQQSLGTADYIFRDYVDQRVTGEPAIDAVRQDPAQGATLVRELDASRPGTVVHLALTYYTGRVDAVIHQSERCNLAGGIATAVDSQSQAWNVGGRPLNVRVVHLIRNADDGAAAANGPHYVAYCYCVNGRRETEAWRVRGMLMNLFERYAWYAKVEVSTSLADPAESQRVLSEFLKDALPEIEKCLPPMRPGEAFAAAANPQSTGGGAN